MVVFASHLIWWIRFRNEHSSPAVLEEGKGGGGEADESEEGEVGKKEGKEDCAAVARMEGGLVGECSEKKVLGDRTEIIEGSACGDGGGENQDITRGKLERRRSGKAGSVFYSDGSIGRLTV